MKKRKTLITCFIAIILLITSIFSYRQINADDEVNVSFSFNALTGETISDLVVDMYKVSGIEWKGQGIGEGDDFHTTYVIKDSKYETILKNSLDIGVKEDGSFYGDLSYTQIDEFAEKIAAEIKTNGYTEDEGGKKYTGIPATDGTVDQAVEKGVYLALVHSSAVSNISDYTKRSKKSLIPKPKRNLIRLKSI